MYFNRISLRLGIWYSTAFVVGTVCLFILIGFFLATSLQRKDRELLEAKFQDYSTILERDGVSGLKTRSSSQKIPDASRFLVRLADSSGKTLFLHPHFVSETDLNAPTIDAIESFLRQQSSGKQWLTIPGENYGDDVELLSRTLPSGQVLQIGKDIEDREEFMKQYAWSFFAALLPIVLLALVAGYLISNRSLAPIRWLTQTVNQIRAGKQGSRVSLRKNGDDFDRLGVLFNQMLDENENLVRGMTETLDHIAHDLRTPVMRLQTAAEAALQDSVSVEGCKEALADCRENADMILSLLNAIMDISEAEAGTLNLNKEVVSAESVIERVISLYDFVAESKDVRLVAKEAQSINILGDKTRLLQMLANLVDNAIKYSPSGTTITISARRETNDAVFEVSDEGPGIPENELTKIWTRLYRGDQSRSTRGMGLGLSLVKAIAHSHGGKVEVLRNATSGCTFRFSLPAAEGSITKM